MPSLAATYMVCVITRPGQTKRISWSKLTRPFTRRPSANRPFTNQRLGTGGIRKLRIAFSNKNRVHERLFDPVEPEKTVGAGVAERRRGRSVQSVAGRSHRNILRDMPAFENYHPVRGRARIFPHRPFEIGYQQDHRRAVLRPVLPDEQFRQADGGRPAHQPERVLCTRIVVEPGRHILHTPDINVPFIWISRAAGRRHLERQLAAPVSGYPESR